MLNFKQFVLTESSDNKNKHLEHLEDQVFNAGLPGIKQAMNFLISLKAMLSGSSKSSVNLSVKWDGAPAIVCGTNPENGRFFVATKSAFNKTPKLNYTQNDILLNHGQSSGLTEKLQVALDVLSRAGIKGILQGDILFTKKDLQVIDHNGQSLVSFKPNTIRYAIPIRSNLGEKILSSNLGIVFHTTYSGKTIESLKASFGANVDYLKSNSRAWIIDADFRDESGTATLTAKETQYVSDRMSELNATISKIDPNFMNRIVENFEMKTLIKTYVNSKIKIGESVSGTKKYAAGLVEFIKNKYQIEIDKLKTEKGKLGKEKKLLDLLRVLSDDRDQFILMFIAVALIVDVKSIFLKKLRTVSSIGTFLETPDGFKVTSPEGFVAVDKFGDAVKLVDRLEFSRANFVLAKTWE